MKKNFLILFFIFYSSLSEAHMDHYKKYNLIEMDVLRNGEIIGFNNYSFKRKGNETIITNKIKFSVKILGTTIFKLEGFGEEKYFEDQLVSYNSKTFQNDKKKFVNLSLDKANNIFNIKGSSYSGNAKTSNIVGNWWNHKILLTDSQISPISGSIKKQVVTFIGKEKIEINGEIYEVERFTIKSKDMAQPKDKRLDFNVWYDQNRSLVVKVSYSRMGNWEYRLKSIK